MGALLRGAVGVANVLSLAGLAAMTIVTVTDVAGRYLFNRPLPGALELSELLMVFLVFGAFAVTELRNGHVDIDVVVNKLPQRARALSETFAATLSTAFWGAITWRTALHAQNIWRAGETTPNLGLPIAPFVWVAAAGTLLFTLALVARGVAAFQRLTRP
ncbi:MAG TPA: TRAP transporter small permease [Methylomirabilota bacterium]|nr:TRAP transporter small permease [Methylomirabilota bacterium]